VVLMSVKHTQISPSSNVLQPSSDDHFEVYALLGFSLMESFFLFGDRRVPNSRCER
jgi:hypothetical protein